jgi:hypothetical protein
VEVEENGVSAEWMSLGVVADELRDGRRCIERVVVGELVIFWLSSGVGESGAGRSWFLVGFGCPKVCGRNRLERAFATQVVVYLLVEAAW